MKIAKYIILLLVLISIAAAVFVFTKDGTYYIEKSEVINIQKQVLFDYVKDLKNNKDYNAWNTQFVSIENAESFDNDSLTQTLFLKDKNAKIKWIFKDTLKSTKVTIATEGELHFEDKLLSLLNKGVQYNFEERFESQLKTINTFMNSEINAFNVKLDGFVARDTVFYIQKIVSCPEKDLPKNIKTYLPKLTSLLKSTGTKSNGSPFIIYHSRDTILNTINFSIAIPTIYKVFTSSESDIFTGQTNPFQAVKATLTGNYSHKPKATQEIFAYMEKNKLEQSDKHKEVDIISSNITTEKSAGKWKTEILIPVRPIKKVFKTSTVKDSTVVKKIKAVI